jgi:nucleotidyltransferase/DNA polymerase involved in DNA repair
MVAMLAALDTPPGTLRHIESASGTSFLREVPLHHLMALGFAPATIERLQQLSIATPGDAATLTRRELHAQLGEDGLRLFDILHLERSSTTIPLFVPPPSIIAEHRFEFPARTFTELQHAVENLLCRLVTELGGRQTQLLTIRLAGRHHVRERVIRRVLKSPTADPVQLRTICEMLLLRMISPDEVINTLAIDLGAVVMPGMEEAGATAVPLLHEAINVISRPFPGRTLRGVIGGSIR